jgi:hypothetical protein
MNNEDFPDLPRNQDSESSPDRDTTPSSSDTTQSSSESTWNTQGILKGFSSPANPGRSSSESYSRLDPLRRVNRKIQRTHPLTGFRLLPQYWGRIVGSFFTGVYLPQKLVLSSPIERQYKPSQKHVSSY